MSAGAGPGSFLAALADGYRRGRTDDGEPAATPPGFTGYAPPTPPTGAATPAVDRQAMGDVGDGLRDVGAGLADRAARTLDLFGRIRSGEVDAGRFARAVGGRAAGGLADAAMAGPDLVRDFLSGAVDSRTDGVAGRAFEAAGSAMTGSMPFSAPAGALRTFGGRAAATADHAALDRAAAMQAAGANPDAIWRGTGWGLGRDGVARFEIPDAAARLLPHDGAADTTLARVLDHPALFAAYPRMRDVAVHHRPELGADAAANPARNWIALNLADPQALDALLHEGQHIVQRHEGFAPGASPLDPAMAAHPRVAEVAALRQRLAGLDAPRAVALADRADQAARFAAYRAAAGEVEARNVEARRAMTPAARAATPPWATQDVAGEAQWLPPGYGDGVTGSGVTGAGAALRAAGPERPAWPILEEIAAAHAARAPGT